MDLDDDALYIPDETAKIFRHPGTRTLERWRAEGTGPSYVKIGRRVAYTGRAIKEYLRQQTRTHTGETRERA
jgi:hypothetical protein